MKFLIRSVAVPVLPRLLKVLVITFTALASIDPAFAENCVTYFPDWRAASPLLPITTTTVVTVHYTGMDEVSTSVFSSIRDYDRIEQEISREFGKEVMNKIFTACDGTFPSYQASKSRKEGVWNVLVDVSSSNGQIDFIVSRNTTEFELPCSPNDCISNNATSVRKTRYAISAGQYAMEFQSIRKTVAVGGLIENFVTETGNDTFSRPVMVVPLGGPSPTPTVTPQPCRVPGLTPLTGLAADFESGVPTESFYPPYVEDFLHSKLNSFQADLKTKLKITSVRASGYRPYAYQRHFYEIKKRVEEVDRVIEKDSTQRDPCAELNRQLDNEIVHHGLDRKKLLISHPDNASHVSFPSQAVDLTNIKAVANQSKIIDLAAAYDLRRPCPTDKVHFTLASTGCPSQKNFRLRWLGFSSTLFRGRLQAAPGNMLITDPLGRRFGYDAKNDTFVDEIGGSSWYSGKGEENQTIEIGLVVPGKYQVQVFSTSGEKFELTTERVLADGTVAESQTVKGTGTTQGSASVSTAMPRDIGIRIQPGIKSPRINLAAKQLKVAIFASPQFNPLSGLVRKSLRFGKRGSEQSLKSCQRKGQDANGDKLKDLICYFDIKKLRLATSSSEVRLVGALSDTTSFEARELVKVIRDPKGV